MLTSSCRGTARRPDMVETESQTRVQNRSTLVAGSPSPRAAARSRIARDQVRRKPGAGCSSPVDASTARLEGCARFLRPIGPQRGKTAICTLRSRLPALECAPGIRGPKPNHSATRRDTGRHSISLHRNRTFERPGRLRLSSSALCHRAGMRSLLCKRFRICRRARPHKQRHFRSDRNFLSNLRADQLSSTRDPAAQEQIENRPRSQGHTALPITRLDSSTAKLRPQ